ncbi:response regulator [Chitinophagaceae bacterium MMS25-I14]
MKHFSRIFLIDDDAVINFMHKKILSRENICTDILLFSNAEAALNEIIDNPIDMGTDRNLILLDINMPGMDGWDFLDEFEKQDRAVQSTYNIIMLTSSISVDDIEKSKTYKTVQGFISKPLTAEKLQKELSV